MGAGRERRKATLFRSESQSANASSSTAVTRTTNGMTRASISRIGMGIGRTPFEFLCLMELHNRGLGLDCLVGTLGPKSNSCRLPSNPKNVAQSRRGFGRNVNKLSVLLVTHDDLIKFMAASLGRHVANLSSQSNEEGTSSL